MLYYSNKARETAIERIQVLYAKLAELPLNGPLNLDDVGTLQGYLKIMESELKREIKENK